MRNFYAPIGLVLVSLVWGSTFWLVKSTLEDFHGAAINAYRFVLASVVLLPWVWKHRRDLQRHVVPGLYMGLVLFLIYSFQIAGIHYTHAANAGFITGLFLLFVPILQFLFQRIVIGREYRWAILLAAVGLWYLTGGVSTFNLGDSLTLVSALFIAGQILLIDRLSKQDFNPVVLTCIQFAVVALLSMASALYLNVPLSIPDMSHWPMFLYLSLVATSLGFLVQILAQRYLSAIQSTMIFMLEPISAALFAWTVGDETATVQKIFGGGLIILSLFYSEIYSRLRQRVKEPADI